MKERIGWQRGDGADALVGREWLVTNGLGGYASGTIAGVATRRYHGLLVAALPNPLGRTMMFNHLSEQLRLPGGALVRLGASRPDGVPPGAPDAPPPAADQTLFGAEHLLEFRLEQGLPVWTYQLGELVLEKRVLLVNMQNTVHITYRLLAGEGSLRLSLRPAVHFRSHDAPVSQELGVPYTLTLVADRFELAAGSPLPPLRMRVMGAGQNFVFEHERHPQVTYRIEEARGYQARGELWSHGHFKVLVTRDSSATLIASTEPWETLIALRPPQAQRYESDRRGRLVHIAGIDSEDRTAAELTLAADQFLIAPAGRIDDATRARAQGEELRTVIAGYHWFTDWGRDTMISLEGLALTTGRALEARWILHSFAHYVRDGLIPNMFPEGAQEGLYHTADATLWFFHAVDRYLSYTSDQATLRQLLPTLEGIVAEHIRGTRFGIRVDPADGLLTQGQEGYQLTWMDAKCDGWVVTPRRGKAVEINALWYNALRVLEGWLAALRGPDAAAEARAAANRARASFNARFWNAAGGYLYDVVDQPSGAADGAFRPNQLFAVSLPHPVLDPERWKSVVDQVAEKLLTPVGLRSLAREHPDYKPSYHGDLRTRDAAYHQGTVWAWLIGPFLDAWLKVYPDRVPEARQLLAGLEAHLGDACIGSISEVFDAEPPYAPRGCIAQAWSVAELLRAWIATTPGRSGSRSKDT
jgi:predicted glycogen debranching enzyme